MIMMRDHYRTEYSGSYANIQTKRRHKRCSLQRRGTFQFSDETKPNFYLTHITLENICFFFLCEKSKSLSWFLIGIKLKFRFSIIQLWMRFYVVVAVSMMMLYIIWMRAFVDLPPTKIDFNTLYSAITRYNSYPIGAFEPFDRMQLTACRHINGTCEYHRFTA